MQMEQRKQNMNSKDHLAYLRTGTGLNTLKKGVLQTRTVSSVKTQLYISGKGIAQLEAKYVFKIIWGLLFFIISFTFINQFKF